MTGVRLVGVVALDDADPVARFYLDKDGNLAQERMRYVGYSHPEWADAVSLDRPITKSWYRSRAEDMQWEEYGEHRIKRNGSCACDYPSCRSLGIGPVSDHWLDLVQLEAQKRTEWLRRRDVRLAKAREYNRRRKAEQPQAV